MNPDYTANSLSPNKTFSGKPFQAPFFVRKINVQNLAQKLFSGQLE